MIDNHDMLSAAERKAAVGRILDIGLADTRPAWKTLSISVLFFGMNDCLFLSVLLAAMGLIPAIVSAYYGPKIAVPAALFLLSPALYAIPHLLTLWKDSMSGTLDWKRTCRIPLRTLLALRMLLFGGAAAAVCVPVCTALWFCSNRRFSLLWLLGLAFSSLFLYAALSLWHRQTQHGIFLTPAVWILLSLMMLFREQSETLLFQIPTAVFFLLAGAGLAVFLRTLYNMISEPKGATLYAVC